MASLRREVVIDAHPDRVWDAIRDVGAIHTRLARGFVTDTQFDGTSRLVTFANGVTVREPIIDVDDVRRRLAYAVVEWRATHYSASFQVFDDPGGRSRVVWIIDLLPNELAELVGKSMDAGVAAMKKTLESGAAAVTASS
jgi:hypothetical protein